eukprot:TRINITY_DN2755_c0_g1_i4.p1 TRINITY_DN2755_c0_g1~~TRINITY_DN2755_c0_g1_i4.p1  ORF type:complete len:451 (-),score=21.92 TRINITY_DN2755_c0_g1_i4:1489-2841(-)
MLYFNLFGNSPVEQEFRSSRQRGWQQSLVLQKITDAVLCNLTCPAYGKLWYQKLPFHVFLVLVLCWSLLSFVQLFTLSTIRRGAAVNIQKFCQILCQVGLFSCFIFTNWVIGYYEPHGKVMSVPAQFTNLAVNLLLGQLDAILHSIILFTEFVVYLWVRSVVNVYDDTSIVYLALIFIILPIPMSFGWEMYQRRQFLLKLYPQMMQQQQEKESIWAKWVGIFIRKLQSLPQKGIQFYSVCMLGGMLIINAMNEWERIQYFKRPPGLSTLMCVCCFFIFGEMLIKLMNMQEQQQYPKQQQQQQYQCQEKQGRNLSYWNQSQFAESDKSSQSLDINQLCAQQLDEKRNMQQTSTHHRMPSEQASDSSQEDKEVFTEDQEISSNHGNLDIGTTKDLARSLQQIQQTLQNIGIGLHSMKENYKEGFVEDEDEKLVSFCLGMQGREQLESNEDSE